MYMLELGVGFLLAELFECGLVLPCGFAWVTANVDELGQSGPPDRRCVRNPGALGDRERFCHEQLGLAQCRHSGGRSGFGADHVVDYRKWTIRDAVVPFDAVFDTAAAVRQQGAHHWTP
ncbi:MAG: hypothetical protein H6737_06220 [Alphaproteobacteria bacterium]|nr:hypothetical protein [Alphaproteobacteria bacterium]